MGALSFATVASSDLQDGTDHYLSIGKSTITASSGGEDSDISGFGFNWLAIKKNANWGFGVTFDYATNEYDGGYYYYSYTVEETMFDTGLNVGYRPESADWLVIMPKVGMSFYNVDLNGSSASESGIFYGIGATARIPSTNVFVELDYKIHKISELDEYDLNSTYIGLGYRF
ncbi:porin family protein [Vibrio chagasii]|uniref:porin family protein n=1 Tax=Vibrio chagasii TaxID=170679 RepID=UPI0035A5D491